MGSTDFFCLCPPKAVQLGDREEAAARQIAELKASIGQHTFKGCPTRLQILVGGGIMVNASAPDACMGDEGHCIAAFSGRLDNYAYLVKKYLLERLELNTLKEATLEDIKAAMPVTEAELVCHLYAQLGRTVPQKLRGDYKFVLYDSNLTRVLAVCSPMAEQPLLQARGADNSLIITSQAEDELPEGCHSVVPILPGYFKYGWNSGVLQFAKPSTETSQTGAEAAAAAKRALSGLLPELKRGTSVQSSGLSFGADSEVGEPPSPGYKKTRRGKRAGANQKHRASGDLARMSSDLRRPSFDYMGASSLQSSASFSSRADEQGWWRSDTPRAGMQGARPASPFRRRSMTATPTQLQEPPASPFFRRESVPAVGSQPSAIRIPVRMKVAEPPASAQATVAEPMGRVRNEHTYGQADAAWDEAAPETRPAAALPVLSSGSAPKGVRSERGATGLSPNETQGHSPSASSVPPALSAGSAFAAVAGLPAKKASGSLSSSSVSSRGASPTPGPTTLQSSQNTRPPLRPSSGSEASITGASPGGSPRRPPRAPGRASFGSMLRAILPRRPSRTNLASTAAPTPVSGPVRSARSSSHGNLVDLDRPTGLWDAPIEAAEPSASQHEESSAPQQMRAAKDSRESMHALLRELPAELAEQLAGDDESAVRLLRKLVTSPNHALMLTRASHPDYPIVYVNTAFEKQTGYSANEVLGRSPRFLQAQQGVQRLPSPPSIGIRKALASGQGTRTQILNYTKAGDPVWNDLSILPLRNLAGNIQHLVGLQTFQPASERSNSNTSSSGLKVLVRKTRNMFSKSKSCNDLAAMEVHTSLHQGLQAH